MADDRPERGPEKRPEDTEPSPDLGRVKRAPPTIDLEASEVTEYPPDTAGDASPVSESPEPESRNPESETAKSEAPESETPKSGKATAAISPWVVAPISGAVAAALVIGVGWMLGWPAVQPAAPAPLSATVIDTLAARLASVEAKTNKQAGPASDTAAAARIDVLEKSVASLRGELTAARAQSEKLAVAINNLNSAPAGAVAPPPDISGINERLDQLEHASRADSAAIAQESAKLADDTQLRRVVVASLLDISVRQGDPYTAALTAAKSLASDAGALKPLDGFASTGMPTAAALSRELLTLVPKLTPPTQPIDTTGSGLIGRLEAGASQLVRIERTDAVGSDRGAVVARVTAAALRNDSSEARRELNTLSSADRAPAQSWIDKADARDAALAASRQFAADAISALAKPAP
jgi:hypothetical protein